MATKYIILNAEGCSLRNLPNRKFNSEPKNLTKLTYHWTFSSRGCGDISKGEYSPTLKKALEHLAAGGFTDLQVVELDEAQEEKCEEVKAAKAVKAGKKQPRTNEEAKELINGIDPSILEEPMYDGVHERCLACNRSCKMPLRCTLWSCPQFSPIGEVAAPVEEKIEEEVEDF